MTQIIDAYIEYLRNISRKIVTRSGFLNVLPPSKPKRPNFYRNISSIINIFFDDSYFIVNTQDEKLYKYFKTLYNFIDSNKEFKLFVGSGLIHGTFKGRNKSNYICAPLFYGIIDIEFEDKEFWITPDLNSCQLNHDIISRLFDLDIEEEFDEEVYLEDNILQKLNNIDFIENKLFDNSNAFDSIKKVISDSTNLFSELHNSLSEFRAISYKNDTNFDYTKRLDAEDDSVNFYKETFLFINQVPHQLSTYEALNTLLNQKPIENKLLKRLFQNVLTDEKVELKYDLDVSGENVNEVVENFMPLSLSENQKSAINKAWTSEISYIQGPPGTGKSYTISAIILTAFFLNKKILLVSHKEAAIRVVKTMIDNLLGEESILYLGSEDRTKTKEYLESIVNEAESNRSNLFENVGNLNSLNENINTAEKEIIKLNRKYTDIYNKYSVLIDLENNFYKSHQEFLRKRDLFVKQYNIKDIKSYKWVVEDYDEDKYYSAISKYKNISNKDSNSRVEYLYKIKYVKHFLSKFHADKDKLFSDPSYSEDIYSLNNGFSKLEFLLKKIDRSLVNQLRKNLHFTEEEYKTKLRNLIKLKFKYSIMLKLAGKANRSNRELISNFKKMLHFKRADILKGKMDSINYDLLLNILPLWCSELRDLGKALPMQNELFDLIIVDEASQVNIAEIIPAFYRGKRYCVVGDKKQLNLNATGVGFAVSKSFEKITWQGVTTKHSSIISYERARNMNLLVTESSILDFVSSETNDFNIPFVTLDEHYRSLPQLASFTNKCFYDDKWKIMSENGENMSKSCFKRIKVDGIRDANKKMIRAEVNEINKILNAIQINGSLPELEQFNKLKNPDEPFTFGILSFLTQQVNEIRELVENKYESLKVKHQIFVATPEEFQGNERDVMFITLGLDSVSRWGKAFYENENRFNVATSRAKYYTYLIYSGIPANANLIKKYLYHFGVEINTDEFLKIIESEIEPQYNRWELNLNNLESDFEYEVYKYLKKYVDQHHGTKIYNQVNACGQKRLDFVLFNPENNVTCAIEVDGKDHFINGSYSYTESHINRISILKRAGWKIVSVKYYNWWDNGWICDQFNPYFQKEISRLYDELDRILYPKSTFRSVSEQIA